MKYATIENAAPIISGNAIKHPGFAMHASVRCEGGVQPAAHFQRVLRCIYGAPTSLGCRRSVHAGFTTRKRPARSTRSIMWAAACSSLHHGIPSDNQQTHPHDDEEPGRRIAQLSARSHSRSGIATAKSMHSRPVSVVPILFSASENASDSFEDTSIYLGFGAPSHFIGTASHGSGGFDAG
jgi:hypothetical protein